MLNLPIIVYSSEKGLDVFSSANFYDEHHNVVPYKGYKLDHNNIYLEGTDKKVLDLSITKNVAMLFINATLMLVVFVSVANAYKRNRGQAPSAVPAERIASLVKASGVRARPLRDARQWGYQRAVAGKTIDQTRKYGGELFDQFMVALQEFEKEYILKIIKKNHECISCIFFSS